MRFPSPSFLLAAALTAVVALGAVAQTRDEYRQYRDRYRDEQRQNNRDRYGSGNDDRGGERNVAGDFDYYALVLSWSPSYCAEARGDDMQCNRRDGRRFNFVLHGLWPQYERGYPQNCRTPRRPFVPQPLIDNMLDIMPSPRLVIHEYRKHGTCSGLSPDAYFMLSRRLFKSITIPQAYRNPMESMKVSPRQLTSDLLAANPGLRPENFAIACGGAGSRLKEVRVCFSKDGKPRSCGGNEDQRRLCSADRMFVPPVRSNARDELMPGPSRSRPPAGNPLPAPRIDFDDRRI